MAASLVQSTAGTAATATVTPTFGAATTSGNLIILSFTSDDYNGTPDTGWNQETGMEQQGNHGGYKWWRLSTGQTSFTYSLGSAVKSAWVIEEWAGLSATPYDISAGQFSNTGGGSYTTPTLTPTAGDRLLHASIGGSLGSAQESGIPGTWTGGFTGVTGTQTFPNTGTNHSIGTAYQLATADGVTTYAAGATYGNAATPDRSGLIAAFKVAGAAIPPVNTVAPAVTGTPTQGQTLTTDNGTWTNTPTGYTYQWQRYTP